MSRLELPEDSEALLLESDLGEAREADKVVAAAWQLHEVRLEGRAGGEEEGGGSASAVPTFSPVPFLPFQALNRLDPKRHLRKGKGPAKAKPRGAEEDEDEEEEEGSDISLMSAEEEDEEEGGKGPGGRLADSDSDAGDGLQR